MPIQYPSVLLTTEPNAIKDSNTSTGIQMACKDLSREGSQVPPNTGLFTHGTDSLFLLFSFLSSPLPSPFPLLPLLLLFFFLLPLPSIYITNTVAAGGNNHYVAENSKAEVDSGKVGAEGVRGLDKSQDSPCLCLFYLWEKQALALFKQLSPEGQC